MKQTRLLLAIAVTFVGPAPQAQEVSRDKIIVDAVAVEVGDAMMECAAIYGTIASCSTNRNDASDLRNKYSQAADKALEHAILMYLRGGISEAAVSAKSKMFAKSVRDKLEGTCSNISVLFEPLDQCAWKQKNSDAWIDQLVSDVDARTPRR